MFKSNSEPNLKMPAKPNRLVSIISNDSLLDLNDSNFIVQSKLGIFNSTDSNRSSPRSTPSPLTLSATKTEPSPR